MKFLAWCWSAIKGIGGKNPGETVPLIGVSLPLPTGYTNMKNKDLLIKTQDSIWDSGQYLPSDNDTFCNVSTQAVLHAFGNYSMDGMTADEMMAFLRTSKDWLVKLIGDCQFLVNTGTVIIAGADSTQLKQGHGHVCTLTPGVEDLSGHWGVKAPVCLSIGQRSICARSLGVNFAFVPMPEFYAWIPSL